MSVTPYDAILTHKIIAIIRGDFQAHIIPLAETLLAQDIRVMEVTMNSPGALDMIERLADRFGDQITIGAGTVTAVQQAAAVYERGGRFVVAPDTFAPVIELALMLGMEPVPGAFTATEVLTAQRAGARLVKLFPANQGGPAYLKTLRGPLAGMVDFVPTGGITPDNARAYLDAGAVALGVGGSLIRPDFDGSPAALAQLRQLAGAFRQAVGANV